MSQLEIRRALEGALNAMTPALATAWENDVFTPPVPTVAYQQAYILFATPDNPESGTGYRELGYMQVTLRYPLQGGVAAVATRAAAIRAAFIKNTSFTSAGVVTTISKTPAIGNGVVDGDRWSVPVKIPFHANIFN